MATWEGKPTLASVLKGYTPPTESPLADPIIEHFKSVPKKFAENQAKQMELLSQAFPGNTYESMMTQGDPKAMAELAMQVPVVGMTNIVKDLPQDWNKLSTMATEAYEALRKNPSKETHDYYKMIMEAKENAPLNNPKNVIAPVIKAEETYIDTI